MEGWVQLAGVSASKKIGVTIPELKINYAAETDVTGKAIISIHAKPIYGRRKTRSYMM